MTKRLSVGHERKMKFISIILSIVMFTSSAFSKCVFSTGIHQLPDGNYEYSRDCNLRVGKMVQDNAVKNKQIKDLNKAISLKDLEVNLANQRVNNWMNTSLKLEKNVQEMNSIKHQSWWIAFGLGALTVIGTGFALSAITNRH